MFCLYSFNIRPSANKDSNCWGQDISKSISKSMANTRLSSCIFKTMGSKENLMVIGCSIQKLSILEHCKK